MGYLIFSDFKKQIQVDNLMQIIGSDLSILDKTMLTAQEEASSYLRQRYDLEEEFTDTALYVNSDEYNCQQRVYLDAPAYVEGKGYAVGELVLYQTKVWKCSTEVISQLSEDCEASALTNTFTPESWTELGMQYDIFHVKYPKPLFNYHAYYKKGTEVYWKNKIYSCIIDTIIVDHTTRIQRNESSYPDIINTFPDDPVNGPKYWEELDTFVQVADELPGGDWTKKDNRSQQMVSTLIDITLYHIHKRISPRNIPELRVKAYDDSISWLNQVRKGDISTNLKPLQPKQGLRTRFSSAQKQVNGY